MKTQMDLDRYGHIGASKLSNFLGLLLISSVKKLFFTACV
jgi:hypothetical protein